MVIRNFGNFIIVVAVIITIRLQTDWLIIERLLDVAEGCYDFRPLVVVEGKGREKSIMHCNANIHYQLRFFMQDGIFSSAKIKPLR